MCDRGQTLQRQIGFLHLLESPNANMISHLTTLPLTLLCTKSKQEKKKQVAKEHYPTNPPLPPPNPLKPCLQQLLHIRKRADSSTHRLSPVEGVEAPQKAAKVFADL